MAFGDLVLDPAELAVGRSELSINSDAIIIEKEGIDWGDAQVAAFSAEQARGELPVGFRMPNRHASMRLMIQEGEILTFAEAERALQAKVALFQQEGGVLKRTTASGATYYADVVNATLSLPQVLGIELEPEATLNLEMLPDFYGAEVVDSVHAEATGGEVKFLIEDIAGDYPARMRLVVTNSDPTYDQLGLLYALRSRHYDPAATAALAYEAEALTPLDQAAVAALAGASGGNVVTHPNLASNWTPVLSTNLAAGAFLTHTGTYRLFAGVSSPAGSAVKLRALWDVGDLIAPTANPPVAIPGASDRYIVDFGELHLDPAPIAPHRWQGQIQAKGDAGGESVSIDELWILPVDETMGRIRTPLAAAQVISAPVIFQDAFNQAAGTLAGKTAPVGGNYTEAGAAGAFSVDGATHQLKRTQVSDAAPHFGLAGVANVAAVTYQLDVAASGHVVSGEGVSNGMTLRYVDVDNYLKARLVSAYVQGPNEERGRRVGSLKLTKMVAGVETDLYDSGQIAAYGALDYFWTLRVRLGADGSWALYIAPQGAQLGDSVASGTDADLKTGGTLEKGKLFAYDKSTTAQAITRIYDNPIAWGPPTVIPASRDAVCFAGQQVEIRTDGVFRTDPTGAGWGSLVPRGDLPRLPPSGLEGRPCEVFVKLSRGDLEAVPDTGAAPLSVLVAYRPSYLFISDS